MNKGRLDETNPANHFTSSPEKGIAMKRTD